MNPDATLSAVVLTRNSSALLERCLQSLKFADELIVIDGHEYYVRSVSDEDGVLVMLCEKASQ